MNDGVLTVNDVEHIQLAVENGRPFHPFVSGAREATLPAVLEYGCLRWAFPSTPLPELPQAIRTSELGCALGEVNSELGIRTTGPENRSWDRLDFRHYGFFVLRDTDQLDDRDWKCFETLYNLSSGRVGLPTKVASQLSVALHEMAANALTHAKARIPVLVGFHVCDGQSLFSVADVGVGVYESLRRHPKYVRIDDHAEAIRCALHDGESGIDPGVRGFGFREVFKALLSSDGVLRFRSGSGCIQMSGADLDADRGIASFPLPIPGFQVTVCCRRRVPGAK